VRRLIECIPLPVQAAVARTVLALPDRAQRLLAGDPIRIDGQELATEVRLMLRIAGTRLERGSIARGRNQLRRVTRLVGGPPIGPVRTTELSIPSPAGGIGARLYRPVPRQLTTAATPSPLLVFYHGGGWVEGDLDTHDNVCRFFAVYADVAVLAVDYRRAPEYPFPAAVNDALVAFRYVVAESSSLDVDPDAIAVGGDSAGANLAAAVGLLAATDQVPPSFLLMLYPPTDVTSRRRSRDLFGDGFLLTDPRINFFRDQYLPDRTDRSDPRASPLLASDLSRLPPTYVATAGFDPLRDEGEAFAHKLAESGVPVILRRFTGLCHGFANVLGVGRRSREAMHEIAGALNAGLTLRPRVGAPGDQGRR
jgi:acetyl esterase